MRIAFCTPFKPLDNPRPSGDVAIPEDLIRALQGFGHEVTVLPYFSCKEIWKDRERMDRLPAMLDATTRAASGSDCVLTYGSYYKVPDAIGPRTAMRLGLPYYLFQGSYAEGRAHDPKTWPGFMLNQLAMLSAEYVFCNSPDLLSGCAKLLPKDRYGSVRPGFDAASFTRDEAVRKRLRQRWGAGDAVVVGCAAMMRRGVKAQGVRWLIRACGELLSRGRNIFLSVAGGGPEFENCRELAEKTLGRRAVFPGTMERSELPGFFSALDVFAFPGIRESIGMVYMEAQACGTPCVATDDLGAPHVIRHEQTGLISEVDETAFTQALDRLVTDDALRHKLAGDAPALVRQRHDASVAYREVERVLMQGDRES